MHWYLLSILLIWIQMQSTIQACDMISSYATCPENQWCYGVNATDNGCLFFHQAPGYPCLADVHCMYICDYNTNECVCQSGNNMTCHLDNPKTNQCQSRYSCDLTTLVCIISSSSCSQMELAFCIGQYFFQ